MKTKLTILALLLICPSLATIGSAAEEKVDQTVTIAGNDMMKFDVVTFEVKAGSKVKITLTNTGKIPKVAMGHNLVLLKSGITAIGFGQKALTSGAGPTNPLPDAVKGDVIAHTKLLGPGESDSIVFTAPAAGEYEYVCTFPGHFALMRGKMVSK